MIPLSDALNVPLPHFMSRKWMCSIFRVIFLLFSLTDTKLNPYTDQNHSLLSGGLPSYDKYNFIPEARYHSELLQRFFAAFALCDIGSIHPADIFSVLIFAGMLLLFSPTLTQRLTNIGAASSVLPRHFYPICRLLAVLYTLFYAAAKHAELSGSFDSCIFRLAFLAAAVIGLYFIFFRFCELSMLFLASDSSGVLPKTLCSSLMVHVLYPSHICSACPVPQTEAALLLRSALLLAVLVSVPVSRCSDPGQHQPVFPATGLIPFSNHHPILHTLLFSLFYHIGFFLTGSINTGIACYVLFQMCTMAAIETYTLSLLARSGASRLWLILSFCFGGSFHFTQFLP